MSWKETLDSFLSTYCPAQNVMGVLRITLRGTPIYQFHHGCADIENGTAFHDGSVFTLYSISKPFCALGLLKLKDLGLVDIDRHPGVYLPEMQGADSRVTLRHMLQHISGLPDFVQTKEFAQKYPQGPARLSREHLKEILKYPQYFVPGTGDKYGNINYLPLALIIEQITGFPYAEYMKQEVFAPLGMTMAQVDREDLVVKNRVRGHALEADLLIPVERNLNWMFGAGDIIGTVDDVYCLNKAIKNRLLLKEETWEQVLTPSPLNHMGMGCRVTQWHGKQRISHNGGSKGFRTLHAQLPEDDFDIIFLSNTGFGDARNDIAEAVHAAFYGPSDGLSEAWEMDKGYI